MADIAVLRPFKGYGRSTGLSPRSPSVFEFSVSHADSRTRVRTSATRTGKRGRHRATSYDIGARPGGVPHPPRNHKNDVKEARGEGATPQSQRLRLRQSGEKIFSCYAWAGA